MKTFEDEREIIEDLKVGKDWSVTYISFKKGAVRGIHYHKETRQVDYLLKGSLKVAYKNMLDIKEPVVGTLSSAGYGITFDRNVAHAYEALEDSEIMSMCFGKRIGENYEEDTFRLSPEEKLL